MKNKKYIISIILLITTITFISTNLVSMGFDYYWHIKAGQYMISNHTILTKDIFSWFLNGTYWMSHEWLYECIIYGLKLIFGKWHIFIYCFTNIFILLSILIFHNKDNYKKNIIATLIWLMVFLFLNVGLFSPRPHLISAWLIASTLYLLYDLKKNKDSKKIYLLPLVSLLWANVHGGSSNLCYLLCLLFIITGLFNIKNKYIEIKKLNKTQLKKYIIVLILIVLAISINPHGLKMLIYPYENIFNTFMQQNISEWRPTSLIKTYNYVYFITIIGIFICLIKSKKKIELTDLLLLILFSYMGIRSTRFWNYIYIGSSFFIFKYLPKQKNDENTPKYLIIFSIIVIASFLVNVKTTYNKLNKEEMISTKIINKIKKEKPKRLFNLYNFGGYLIYNDIDVFVDGRADLYSNYNYKDYISISNLENNYKELIKKYDFDYFIVNNEFEISKYLKSNKNYVEIIKDKKTILYKKKDT